MENRNQNPQTKGENMKTYELAFSGPGNEPWDIVEEFEAFDDRAANAWAEANEDRMEQEYNNSEWYVLHNGHNING